MEKLLLGVEEDDLVAGDNVHPLPESLAHWFLVGETTDNWYSTSLERWYTLL